MRGFQRCAKSLASDMASPARVALATTVVFVLSLCWGWSTSGQDCSGGGPNMCTYQGTACIGLTDISCVPVGFGYTCIYQGAKYVEGYWSMTRFTPWLMCTSPATLKTMQCNWSGPSQCGTMYYYRSGNNSCAFPCSDTQGWYWQGCYGAGNAC
jgi:hypothetical protein